MTVLWPTLEDFVRDYPDVHGKLDINSGFADIVSERFDAGIRLGEALAKDMIAVRIGPELRMAIVGSPDYFEAMPVPKTPQDLAAYNCINLRLNTAGGFYARELEQSEREIKVRVDGQLIFNDMR